MNKLAMNMNTFWNNTDPRNAHLGLSGETEAMEARYRALILDRISVKNKVVIDFGHGGGLLGKLLFTEGIKKYVGYDLAERSNKVASENLKDFENKELILLKQHVWNFAEKKPNIIVCLACIIHFPTQVYLDNFLKTCNESGAKYLVLEIRDIGAGTRFQNEPYGIPSTKVQKRTCLTCETNETYVSKRLPGYECIERTNPDDAPTKCQILWYRKVK